MKNFSFFYSRGGSGYIRGKQMADFLDGKHNPTEGFENDICIYVKILPPDPPPKYTICDVDDSPKQAEWLKSHPEVGVIAISKTAKDWLNEYLGRNDVVFIPHQHCNFERRLRPDKPVKVVGIIGSSTTAFQAPVEPFRKELANIGLELRFEQDYWNTYKTNNKQEMRLNVADFYYDMDIQVGFRPKVIFKSMAPFQNPNKLGNSSSFGIPMVAYPEPSYIREFGDSFVHARTIEEMLNQIKRLKDDLRYYKYIAKKALAIAEDYHIDNVSKRYLKLEKHFFPANKQKEHWEGLANKNSRYYINSDFGKGITEDEFTQSGREAYNKLIAQDKLLKDKKSIVDYGCGTGRLTQFMAKDFKKVIGIDISNKMISEAKAKFDKLKNVEFYENDGQSILLPDNSVDIVFAYLVFQHIKKRPMVQNAFKDIFRVLTPGGIFKVLMRSDKQKNMDNWWSGVEYSPEKIKKVYNLIGFSLLKFQQVDENSYWLWLQKPSNLKKKKWDKGKNNTIHFYRKKLPWKAKQFNQPLHLPDYFNKMIGKKKEVTIAELGSGMFCTIGSLHKTAKVTVYPSDALADEFNQILKESNIKPLIPVEKQDMENLTYPDSFFDIVHSVNALDHTTNPLKAIYEMHRVCKPGGYIYLRHFINVGEREKYAGLHMWNINIDDAGDCIIWNPKQKFSLSEHFPGFKSAKRKEMDYETEDLVVSILNKT